MTTASDMRKQTEDIFGQVNCANDILSKLMGDCKKAELLKEVENLKQRMEILLTIDNNLKLIDEFNKCFKSYLSSVNEQHEWLKEGRKRMDSLLKPEATLPPEERVMLTMELQSDIEGTVAKFKQLNEIWMSIQPSAEKEKSEESEACVATSKQISNTQNGLLEEVKAEGEKFGEDVKYLADFTGGQKKFEPWIQAAEAKKSKGMSKPANLTEAINMLNSANEWKKESYAMKKILDDSNTAAQKMTLHDEPDLKHAICIRQWEAIDKTAEEWISKLNSMVLVWQKQAETAQKVTAAIAANPDDQSSGEMKLEDLEKHLDSLRQMFIEKQKMMEELGDTQPKS